MNKLIEHIKIGLKNGYEQNLHFHTSYTDNQKTITEYLLTVNTAQQLWKWNEEQDYNYSIHLEYPTDEFFTKAFLPYLEVGETVFDMSLIHPEVTKAIRDNDEIRTGRIDIAICKEKSGFANHKESIFGIEIKGINPNHDKVFEDIRRLVLAIEMKDDNIQNSLQSGYCVFVKRLGGDKRVSTKKSLESARKGSIEHLTKLISNNIEMNTTKISVESEIIFIKTREDFDKQGNKEDVTFDEVTEGTVIVFSVIIHIQRQE